MSYRTRIMCVKLVRAYECLMISQKTLFCTSQQETFYKAFNMLKFVSQPIILAVV